MARMRTVWAATWLVVALVMGGACSKSEAPQKMAAPPFTAAQIRAATAAGRTYVWNVVAPGKADSQRRVRFIQADDEGAQIGTQVIDAAGSPVGEEQVVEATWSALEGHGTFPVDALKVSDANVTVPAGTYACWLYEVKEPDGSEARFWFAKNLPGAPVRIEAMKDGKLLETRELVSHEAGKAP
ncbi:MAG: hypothetical protein U1F43_05250 [Myxococcota bacterium]